MKNDYVFIDKTTGEEYISSPIMDNTLDYIALFILSFMGVGLIFTMKFVFWLFDVPIY